jgi:hypothetical protein
MALVLLLELESFEEDVPAANVVAPPAAGVSGGAEEELIRFNEEC